MLGFWKSAKPCSRWKMSRESQGRILCIDPPKQRPAFFRIGRDECDTGWRRQKRHRRRINNLEQIKAESVRDQRQYQENYKNCPLPPRQIPGKEKRFGSAFGSEAIHLGGVAARATEVMPCSSAAFVTVATVSYDTERSALMMIDWSLRLAASSNGSSCSMVTFWS